MTHQSSKIAGSSYNVVIRLMEMPKCFYKEHHLFTDNLFASYASAEYTPKRLLSNWYYARKPDSQPVKWNYDWKTQK